MDTSDCVKNEMWEAYAAGTLREPGLLYLQKHVESCEICADIKEGIDAMAKPEEIRKEVALLHQKTDAYLQAKNRGRIIRMYSGIAAALIAVIGLGWFFLKNDTNPYADQTAEKFPEKQLLIGPLVDSDETDMLTVKPGTKPEVLAQNYRKTNNRKDNSRVAHQFQPNVMALSKKEVAAEYAVEESKKAEEKMEERTEGDSVSKAIIADALNVDRKDSVVVMAMTQKALTDEVKKTADKPAVIFTESTVAEREVALKSKRETYPSNYSNNNLGNSHADNSISDDQVSTDSIHYEEALTWYRVKGYEACITALEQGILKGKHHGSFYESGAFLKAKALLGLNKNKEAKEVLKEVISLNGAHLNEAKELLAGIK